MEVETYGRARLEVTKNYSAILVWDKLDADIKKTPRPVKHVGNEKYIRTLWTKIKQNSAYLKDVVTINDWIDSVQKGNK